MRPLIRTARHAIDLVLALKHLSVPILLLFAITVIGAVGYALLLDIGPVDAMYQSVTTLTTIGFSEVKPFDTHTKLFTIALSFVGVGAALYVITMLAATVVEGELKRNFRRRIMMREIGAMKDHLIVCGFGRVGEDIAKAFHSRGRDFVIVDNEPAAAERAMARGYHVVQGSAQQEEILREAKVDRAGALVAATTSDACNTYITLTARNLNSKLFIVARSETPDSADKLSLAGANRIVSPYAIGARRMALSALQPRITDFMDALTGDERQGGLILAELEVETDSSLDGATLVTAFSGTETTVLAIRRADRSFVIGPKGGDVMRTGDIVILMAPEKDLARLAQGKEA